MLALLVRFVEPSGDEALLPFGAEPFRSAAGGD